MNINKYNIVQHFLIIIVLLTVIFSVYFKYLDITRTKHLKPYIENILNSPFFIFDNGKELALKFKNIEVKQEGFFSDKVSIYINKPILFLLNKNTKEKVVVGDASLLKVTLDIPSNILNKKSFLIDKNNLSININNFNFPKNFIGYLLVYENIYSSISYKQMEYLYFLEKIEKKMKNINADISFTKPKFKNKHHIYLSDISVNIYNKFFSFSFNSKKILFKKPKTKNLYFKDKSGKIFNLNLPKNDIVLKNSVTKVKFESESLKNFMFELFKINELASAEGENIKKFFSTDNNVTKESFLAKINNLNNSNDITFSKILSTLMKYGCVEVEDNYNIGLIEFNLRKATDKNFKEKDFLEETIAKCKY